MKMYILKMKKFNTVSKKDLLFTAIKSESIRNIWLSTEAQHFSIKKWYAL